MSQKGIVMNRRNWFKTLSVACLAPILPDLAKAGLTEGAVRQSEQYNFGSKRDFTERPSFSIRPHYTWRFDEDGTQRSFLNKHAYVRYEPALTSRELSILDRAGPGWALYRGHVCLHAQYSEEPVYVTGEHSPLRLTDSSLKVKNTTSAVLKGTT